MGSIDRLTDRRIVHCQSVSLSVSVCCLVGVLLHLRQTGEEGVDRKMRHTHLSDESIAVVFYPSRVVQCNISFCTHQNHGRVTWKCTTVPHPFFRFTWWSSKTNRFIAMDTIPPNGATNASLPKGGSSASDSQQPQVPEVKAKPDRLLDQLSGEQLSKHGMFAFCWWHVMQAFRTHTYIWVCSCALLRVSACV